MATTIALTGAMGCGKSTAAKVFAELGAAVIDADGLAHEAIEKDPVCIAAVKRVAGEAAYLPDGRANRPKIAEAVFGDSEKLAEIEKAVHPTIEKMWRARIAELEKSGGAKVAVVEVPLLFEKNLEKKFDFCITVFCSEKLRLERLAGRGMSPEQISERDARQMPPPQKLKLADVALFNESGLPFLKEQARLVLSRLT